MNNSCKNKIVWNNLPKLFWTTKPNFLNVEMSNWSEICIFLNR
jgi:hypothetical protein